MRRRFVTAPHNGELERHFDELYERYGKPLEAKHRGEFLAVSEDGRTLLGKDLFEVVERAAADFGPENFIFKVGEKSVGKWR
jgi:hypothetical protein